MLRGIEGVGIYKIVIERVAKPLYTSGFKQKGKKARASEKIVATSTVLKQLFPLCNHLFLLLYYELCLFL